MPHQSLGITFNDVSLIPQYSDIKSRNDVDLSVDFLGFPIKIPLMSANMSTVTGPTMVSAMSRNGGIGILHRYEQPGTVIEWIKFLRQSNIHPIIPSIGIQTEAVDLAAVYQDVGADAINIDVAHGHCKRVVDLINHISGMGIKVIAGNVCTYEGAKNLIEAGADVIKVNVGAGSVCTTRVVTGHGVPQLSALTQCVEARNKLVSLKNGYKPLIISDGGVSNSGDCVKALAFGADLVMSGYLFAGCPETPGEVVGGYDPNSPGFEQKFKRYSGMASQEARNSFGGTLKQYMPEGVATLTPVKESVDTLLPKIAWGIKSGLSYSGAKNLAEFRAKVKYMMVTNSGEAEGRPWAQQS
jgi:IMP dehydrogenase